MKSKDHKIRGIISTTAKGAGYIDDITGKSKSIYIEEGSLNTALNGDTVEVAIVEKGAGKKTERVGKIINIVSRAKQFFVGTISIQNGKCFLKPDDRKMYVDILIKNSNNLKDGQKVYVKFISWQVGNPNPEGEIVRVLGEKGMNEVEMESILLEKNFELNFPENVEREANQIELQSKTITDEELKKRRDMRSVLTFTIDPYDAKDFDDAISFREISREEVVIIAGDPKKVDLKGPFYEIGVHIADVSHYVREGSALDKEALKRGCSVYLVDRTIPMLPHVLSNNICSLNPQEDKMTFSAVFIVDERANIISRWFGRTIICSAFRFTYESAQAVIDGQSEAITKYSKGMQSPSLALDGMKYRDQLNVLNRIAKIFQRNKFSKGAINFEQEEISFRLDEKGKPIGVYSKERLDTHKLVEEYMLLANREVAKYIFDSIKNKGKRNTGAIYRIHDTPDKDKIANLSSFVKALGYTLKTKDGIVSAKDINNLLEQIEDTPHESLIRTAAIRSMQKAVYSTNNIGHFGLAFNFYTHFTSPIRRYPDLLVHRVLQKHLDNTPFGDRDIVVFQKIAESSTRREIDASEAERASKKLKQVEYMSERIGQEFKGKISGVTKWGLYIEENETKSEGMVAIRDLGNDYFVYDEKSYSIIGEKTKMKFTLGDVLSFKVKGADLDKKTLDYQLV